MVKKILFGIHLTVSLFIFAIAIGLSIRDIFLVGRFSIGNFFLFTCPASLAIPTAFLSFGYLLQKPRPKAYYLPIIINMITMVIGIFLYQFDIRHPDYAFQRNYSSYEEVIKLDESRQLIVRDDGIVLLPDNEKGIFRNNVVYIVTDLGIKTFYFEDGYDNSDNISWGYIYRADGSPPSNEDKCFHWRNLVPRTPNWYYCDVHSFVGFPVDNNPK